MSDNEVIRLLRIRGRVQGVGYRAFAHDEATQLGLHGWARNRRDGSVEVLVRGHQAVVNDLIASLRRGPPGARVTEILETTETPEALSGPSDRFEILSTL